MARTWRHKIKGMYSKARTMERNNDDRWLNWHQSELCVYQHHRRKFLTKRDIYGLKMTVISYDDGHGWAVFELIPKTPSGHYNLYNTSPGWWNTLHHTRPARRHNKYLIYKCLTNPEDWYNMTFPDYKKPQEYYW